MKYVLILGLQFKQYKAPATITIQTENRFIDRFQLENDCLPVANAVDRVDRFWLDKLGKSYLLTYPEWAKRWQENSSVFPSFFKVYHLDDHAMENTLDVKIDNDNSDATNGFMKNSSLIKFSLISLLPADFVKNRGEKYLKITNRIKDGWAKHMRRNHLDEWQARPLYNRRWPVPKYFRTFRNKQSISEGKIESKFSWIGGSFTARFPIKKKHNIRYLGSANSKEAGFYATIGMDELFMVCCKDLLNIYDENQ